MTRKRLIRRRDKILEMLEGQDEVSVSSLLTELQVSDETLRKDLIDMERQGMVLRKHGKVSLVLNCGDDDFGIRTMQNSHAKERIAREVLRHIPAGDEIIGLDVGTTTWNVAKLLLNDPSKTIVTNSMEIVSLYAQEEKSNVYCAGGNLRGVDKGFYGYWTMDNLKTINMTVSVIGTPGIMNRDGIGAISFDDKDIKQIYTKNSQKVIAAFDSTKCTRGALVDGVSWDDIDLVITDDGIPEADRERIEKRTTLIIV